MMVLYVMMMMMIKEFWISTTLSCASKSDRMEILIDQRMKYLIHSFYFCQDI